VQRFADLFRGVPIVAFYFIEDVAFGTM
jgi:hypothetical protein